MDDIFPIIIIAGLAGADILLLKLGLMVTRAQKRTRFKWVAGSFALQFGAVFAINSPSFIMGIAGVFQGEAGDIIPKVLPLIIISLFINLNLINILHQGGLKRSLIVLVFNFAPIVLLMVGLGMYLPRFF